MKKGKPVEGKAIQEPLPQVNRTTVNKLLVTAKESNLREVSMLMSQGFDQIAAELFSTMTPEGHPAFPYRLEMVARLAALLVKNGGFTQAAKEAIALLDACRAELSEITLVQARHVLEGQMRSQEIPGDMNFAGAARYVTKLTSDKAALPWFRRFVKYAMRIEKIFHAMKMQSVSGDGEEANELERMEIPEITERELTQWIRKQGDRIPGQRLRDWRDRFPEWKTNEISQTRRTNGIQGGRGKKKHGR